MCAATCTSTENGASEYLRDERFRQALRRIVSPGERERHGIGMQKEKTLHAVLKAYEDPDEDHHEIPIVPYIADIYNGSSITEIQTAGLDRLRDKLRAFLPAYPVTVVYPIPASKWVIWVDPATGETGKKNRSPLKGSFYTAFKELYKISGFLTDPNLTVKLILLDMDEYRLQDGWSRDGKRGSHRYDRIPLRIVDETVLSQPRDYLQFIPYELPETFTAAELARSAGCRAKGFSTAALVLYRLGVIERVGKRGRAYLYRVPEALQ